MTPADLDRAKAALLGGASLDAVCEALGCSRRTLEREWRAATGLTPERWRREHAPPEEAAETGPVSFRLPEFGELQAAAEAEGVSPHEWARRAVQRALSRRRGRA